jgi:hypothetical protein
MISGWFISRLAEVVCTFLWGEGVEKLADCRADGFDGSGGGFAQQVLELGEDLFDGV